MSHPLADILEPLIIDNAPRYDYALPEHALTYPSLPALRADITSRGNFYFSRATVTYFRAKFHGLYGGRFFVESTMQTGYGEDQPRTYRASWFVRLENGHVSSEHTHPERATLAEARADAKRLAAHVATIEARADAARHTFEVDDRVELGFILRSRGDSHARVVLETIVARLEAGHAVTVS